MTHARVAGASHKIIENYFDILEATLSEHNIADRPCQIYNLDESGFPLNPKAPKVISKKCSSSERSQISVLCCCNAGGNSIPPLVIFDRKVLKPELTVGEVPGTIYGLNDSGWMDKEIFELWFLYHFLVYAPPMRPLLILMDGHSSHFSPQFVNKAAEEQILVFCLPPHTTHLAQPLDKGVFSPLKQAWREVCHDYVVKNPGKVVTRFQFSSLFGQAMTPENIMAGFRVTGVYPTDRFRILPKESTKPLTLCERTGLKFIPLLTPFHSRTRCSLARVPPESDKSMDDVSLESPLNQDDSTL